MAERITQRTIAKLSAPERGNRILYDAEVPGFGVRITSAGAVSFVLNYHIRGRERRYTIGRWPETSATAARATAIGLRGRIAAGDDPLEEREQRLAEPTVSDLASEYLAGYAATQKRAGSIRNDRGILANVVIPRLGALRLSAVGQRDIEALKSALKATPVHANRSLALLSKMFNLAIRDGWCTENPVHGVARFQEQARDRWLSEEELQRLTHAVDEYSDQNAADAIRLILLTGSREGETLKAEWSEFDLDRGVWTKPSHHTKLKRVSHVPLSAEALALLRRMKANGGGALLFPGRKEERARVTLRKVWIAICRNAGLAESYTIQGKRRLLARYRPTCRVHDLRHTFASHLATGGTSLHIVGKLLGHVRPETTMRYAHLQDSALREAADRFGDVYKAASNKASRRKEPVSA